MRRPAIVFALSIALRSALAAPLAGCTKGATPDQAALRAEDRRVLERVIALDVLASRAMRDADAATGEGDAGAAVVIAEGRAKRVIDEALGAADAATPRSDWGRAKRDELLGILHDRKAELPRYVEAVKGGDPERALAAIEAQAAIERRALATVAAVNEGR